MKKRIFAAVLLCLLLVQPPVAVAAPIQVSMSSNLDIEFRPAKLLYALTAAPYTPDFQFTFTPLDPKASLSVNGTGLDGMSGSVPLRIGLNTVTMVLTNFHIPVIYTFQILVPICTGGANCPSAHFTDMGHQDIWYHQDADFCLARGLLQGTSPTTFSPDSAVTRGQFVTVLWRYCGAPQTQQQSPFTDLTKDYYRDAIAWAWEKGIARGTAPTSFSPDSAMTRQQLATLLYRFSESVLDVDVSKQASLKTFPDGAQTQSYAIVPLSWAVAENLITGSLDGITVYLRPNGTATRAQLASVLRRYCENIAD